MTNFVLKLGIYGILGFAWVNMTFKGSIGACVINHFINQLHCLILPCVKIEQPDWYIFSIRLFCQNYFEMM